MRSNDPLSEELWRQHEEWLEAHEERKFRRWMEQERWSDEDWARARLLSEERWDATDFYVYDALRALEHVHFERIK